MALFREQILFSALTTKNQPSDFSIGLSVYLQSNRGGKRRAKTGEKTALLKITTF